MPSLLPALSRRLPLRRHRHSHQVQAVDPAPVMDRLIQATDSHELWWRPSNQGVLGLFATWQDCQVLIGLRTIKLFDVKTGRRLEFPVRPGQVAHLRSLAKARDCERGERLAQWLTAETELGDRCWKRLFGGRLVSSDGQWLYSIEPLGRWTGLYLYDGDWSSTSRWVSANGPQVRALTALAREQAVRAGRAEREVPAHRIEHAEREARILGALSGGQA